ncbi:MAG: decaprenyl-phosphate phosphoribosyltransferase [candidate division Zixibacteria bacterium]|nr:decaprenyl-phosphate phosphoribosyltransferase [candidate division Zixibacteria bacterium]
MKLKDILSVMRPEQWVKNLILFAGVIFSENLQNTNMLLKVLIAFAFFCLLSSAGYVINDTLDFKQDSQHPVKANRPIASGRLKRPQGVFLACFLAVVSLAGSYVINPNFFIVALVYLSLNICYSLFLKHVVIIDVMVIALGFVLRAVAGAVVINVDISSWLVVCTILLALFLGLGKRRHELVLLEGKADAHRRILTEYSLGFLDQMIAVVTSSTVVAYAFYTLSPEIIQKLGTRYMALTIPFVLYGIFRYLYLIHQKEEGGSPAKALLTDKPIIIDILLWLVAVILILYL